uniref:AlNc14C440G11658 protein n=1 Tax=Albugo laibachii Nc14 TaxID=890382 RepID=F0WZR7_9STRA|nr:AlNc14C440G11658 [Albugo laibachii Nc14]|eukprot:CCA26994.1 AlNc14C440G11658 [Albugo laibachii Nc14]
MPTAGKSQREIARIIGRSNTVVKAYLRNPEGYNTMRRPGRRSSLTPANFRRIVRLAQTGQYSSLQIVRTINLTVSARSVRNVLAREDTLRYVKRESIPMLTKAYKLARLK